MISDILPEFRIPTEKPPITILRELAVELSHKTHNLVRGQVYTMPLQGEQLLHAFEARAVALNDYTLPLFYITHGLDPYESKTRIYLNKAPAQANAATEYECDTQEAFEQALKKVFELPRVRGTIESMLSQSRAIEIEEAVPGAA